MNKEKTTKTRAEEIGSDLLFLADAAAFLGMTKSYLYKLTSAKQIPFIKYGGRRVLFERVALERWRSERMLSIPTQAEATAHAVSYCATNPLKR